MQKCLFLVGLFASFGLACSNRSDDCEKNANCGDYVGGAGGIGGNAGQGGTGGVGGDAGNCDVSKSPSEEACLVNENYGVFVNGTVTTSGDGSRTSPFKTISEGLAAAQSSGKSVLVCNTTYDEKLVLSFGVKLFGGFACADWAYESGARPKVQPSATGHALEVASVTDVVVVEDFEFIAQPGATAGESSIAAFVTASTQVSLSRLRLVAGSGVTGAPGSLTTFTFPAASELNGVDANGGVGGMSQSFACPDGTETIGAAGGVGGTNFTGGGTGQPELGTGGEGGTGTDCGDQGFGKKGKDADRGGDGTGATIAGSATASGWTTTTGESGSAGGPGEGGGGGAGVPAGLGGGGGGGGGAGACGGAASTGAQSGGSSIALLIFESSVTIKGSTLVTSSGGDGGTGVAGQPGQPLGGFAGAGKSGGCSGGAGGKGGAGGAGGGGAGGMSVGIAYKGSQPTISEANYEHGSPGAKGDGGKPGVNDGADGTDEDFLAVP